MNQWLTGSVPVRLVPRPLGIVDAIRANWKGTGSSATPVIPLADLLNRAAPPCDATGNQIADAFLAGTFAILAAGESDPRAWVHRIDCAIDHHASSLHRLCHEAPGPETDLSVAYSEAALAVLRRWRAAIVAADLDLAGQHAAEGRRATG